MSGPGKKQTVAYVPFKTFLAAVERLERHMPNQIDSSVWPSYSGAIKSQLLGSFRFLGFIDPRGRPTSTLKAIVEDKPARKTALRKVLEAKYRPIVALGLQNTTPKQFREAMNGFGGMTGATQKKVLSFFLKAAKYSELPIAPILSRKAHTLATRRKRSEEQDLVSRFSKPREASVPVDGTSKTIGLKSGGELTLTLSGNVLDLTPADRGFVFRMIDELQDYTNDRKLLAK
jgi:hypothetical protein